MKTRTRGSLALTFAVITGLAFEHGRAVQGGEAVAMMVIAIACSVAAAWHMVALEELAEKPPKHLTINITSDHVTYNWPSPSTEPSPR